MEWISKDEVDTSDDDKIKINKLIEGLEDLDDVNSVYSNAKL